MLNISSLKKLLQTKYEGNLSNFAKALKLPKSTLSRLLSGQRNAGLKTIFKIIAFCKQADLNVSEYVFL